MADPLDIASELAELHNQAALQRHNNTLETNKESAFYCLECDEVIPHARRAAIIGVQRCIQCQQINELKRKQVAI